MPTPFAALEAKVNRAVATKLVNAELVFAGVTTPVCFLEASLEVTSNAIQPQRGRQWHASAPWDDFGATPAARGDTVSINGVDYVVGARSVDATSWTTYTLTRA